MCYASLVVSTESVEPYGILYWLLFVRRSHLLSNGGEDELDCPLQLLQASLCSFCQSVAVIITRPRCPSHPLKEGTYYTCSPVGRDWLSARLTTPAERDGDNLGPLSNLHNTTDKPPRAEIPEVGVQLAKWWVTHILHIHYVKTVRQMSPSAGTRLHTLPSRVM